MVDSNENYKFDLGVKGFIILQISTNKPVFSKHHNSQKEERVKTQGTNRRLKKATKLRQRKLG